MRYEVTVFANPGVTAEPDGIEFIRPYAAYDVSSDEWSVVPDPHPYVAPNPSWDAVVERDRMAAESIVRRYLHAVETLQHTTNPAVRRNTEAVLSDVLDSAAGLFEEIHHGRHAAFAPNGGGYGDFGNYRWQAGKANGAVPSLRRLKDYWDASNASLQAETYGVALPDASTLVRRAATRRPF